MLRASHTYGHSNGHDGLRADTRDEEANHVITAPEDWQWNEEDADAQQELAVQRSISGARPRAGGHASLSSSRADSKQTSGFTEWQKQLLRRLYRIVNQRLIFRLLVISVPLVWAAMWLVRAAIRARLEAQQQHILDLPTCSARLHALGLDLPVDETDMRVAVSRYALDRMRVYDGMGSGILKQGLKVGGVITQGLSQDDLFKVFRDARSNQIRISPILHSLEVPVRAMVIPLLDPLASNRIVAQITKLLLPQLPEGTAWLQDDKLYHATLYHASSHQKPIPARPGVVERETDAIRSVTTNTCPIRAALDRVVITSSGVVVACWQILPGGGEPALLRAALSAALPDAPPKEAQMVKEPAMLHTTLARLLQPRMGDESFDGPAIIAAVAEMSKSLCGLTTTFHQVWFIEEQDLLALALNGRYTKHVAELKCPPGGLQAQAGVALTAARAEQGSQTGSDTGATAGSRGGGTHVAAGTSTDASMGMTRELRSESTATTESITGAGGGGHRAGSGGGAAAAA